MGRGKGGIPVFPFSPALPLPPPPILPTTQRGLWRGQRYPLTKRTVGNNDDGDGNENDTEKKVISSEHQAFLHIFFAVVARLRREGAYF